MSRWKPADGKDGGLEAPVQLGAEFVFKLSEAIVTEKNHPGVAVILDGQVAPEGLKPAALDAIKVGFGGEGGADDLLPYVPGVNDRVEKLTLIGLHTPIPSLSAPGFKLPLALPLPPAGYSRSLLETPATRLG